MGEHKLGKCGEPAPSAREYAPGEFAAEATEAVQSTRVVKNMLEVLLRRERPAARSNEANW
jgi:hypothetical protein